MHGYNLIFKRFVIAENRIARFEAMCMLLRIEDK